jgi:hypothetical protein
MKNWREYRRPLEKERIDDDEEDDVDFIPGAQ